MAAGKVKACMRMLLLCAFALFPFAQAWSAPLAITVDAEFERLIGDREVVFLARELASDRMHAFAPERIDQRHPPFSTFKIPNFLIALESGVIDDPDAHRDWDPAARPAETFWPDSWKQSQSLATAFRRSAVWFFRDVAMDVGGERYRRDLARFDYGNRAAPDGSDDFWLDGTLLISPLEQVDFVVGLLQGEFGIASEHLAKLRAVSLLRDEGGCRLHGKTGAGPAGEDFDGPFEGWLVGWSQCGEAAPTVYALWTRGSSFGAIRDFRQEAAIRMLQHIGAWTFNDYGDQYVGIRKPGGAPDEESGGFRPVGHELAVWTERNDAH